jgi:chitinase
MTELFLRFRAISIAIAMAGLCWMQAVAFAARFPLRHSNRPIVVGYLSESDLHYDTPFYIKYLVTNGSAARLDQINYASASVQGGHCSLADPTVDLTMPFSAENSVSGAADDPASNFRGNFHQLAELKRRYPRLRILISLEGRAPDFAVDAQPANRVEFVRSCVDLYLHGKFADGVIRPGLFDGIDVDWESPHLEDAANFQALIEEFRRQMDAVRPGLRLAVAVNQNPHALPGTNFKAIAAIADQIGVMNYDYAGPWSKTTGFIAPLFSDAFIEEQEENVEKSISAYQKAGVPSLKLLMGLPFYGYGWSEVMGTNNGLFQTGRGVRGDHPYAFFRSQVKSAQMYRDKRSQAPWIFDGQNFWTYDDPVSIRYKVSFAARQGLAGVMVWELSDDGVEGELLSTAYRSLHHPLPARVFVRAPEEAAEDFKATEKSGGVSE